MDENKEVVFKDVRYCYGEVCAVNSVSFHLPKNTITALVGPNGGGKSTIIKLLTGLLKPEEGSINYRGGIKTGYVSQNVSFDTSFPMTVEKLVLQGTLSSKVNLFGRYSAEQKQKALEALKYTGLEGFEQRGIQQLSAGQLKRAVIARAMASDTGLVALDEPDASLDVDAAKEFYEILTKLKNSSTVIIASHNIDSVFKIADRAVYVNKTVREYESTGELSKLLKGGILL